MSWKWQKEPEPSHKTAAPRPKSQGPVVKRGSTEMNPQVSIGKSIKIKGEISGNEDLSIDGHVDGKIRVKGHNLRIGPNGQVIAKIHAKSVTVAGDVTGDISAEDKVELSSTGTVKGDIRAPRVVLADGARFKGNIDMEPKSAAAAASVSRMPMAETGKTAASASPASADLPRIARTGKG